MCLLAIYRVCCTVAFCVCNKPACVPTVLSMLLVVLYESPQNPSHATINAEHAIKQEGVRLQKRWV